MNDGTRIIPPGPLTQAKIGEALKRLRHMIPAGPKGSDQCG
jgi:hypothetical protein